jgi:hypothetical protein
MCGVHILDFPTEILAKVFQEADVETAWSARAVCRYWYEVFEMVAYGSAQSPFANLHIGVEAICGIQSPRGELLDSHVLHGDLSLLSTKPTPTGRTHPAKWSCKKERYEYWPGGQWRAYAITDVLTDVRLRISGIPTRGEPLLFPLGTSVALTGDTIRSGLNSSTFHRLGTGPFKDFLLTIDTVEEPSCCGKRLHHKHYVKGLQAPKWQIYGLLVQFIKRERESKTYRRRHYSICHQHIHVTQVRKPTRSQSITGLPSCGPLNEWTQLPPRLDMGWVEC